MKKEPLVLAVETSTIVGSVALIKGDRLISEYTLNVPRTHSKRLMPAIDQILRDSEFSINELDAFAVGIGPGSFTGLRIGIATIKGLAMATGKSIVSVSTLDALAHNAFLAKELICPMIDARKKEVYSTLYRKDEQDRIVRLTDDLVSAPEPLLARIKQKTVFLGDGAELYKGLINDVLGSLACFAPIELSYPRAFTVARLGVDGLQKGKGMKASKLVPLYVRPSDAEIKR